MLNNLQFYGRKPPSRKSAIPGVIAEEAAVILEAGINFTPPTKYSTFTYLCAKMEELGLFRVGLPSPVVKPKKSSSEISLNASHLLQVRFCS